MPLGKNGLRSQKATPPIAGAIATGLCALFGIIGAVAAYTEGTTAVQWSLAASAAAYLAGGFRPTLNAIQALRARHLDVDVLMIIAAVGAALIGDWLEGVVLLFLFSLSGTLEAFAMYRTTRSI